MNPIKGAQFSGKQFILEPWQTFVVGSAFGWQNKRGLRRFKEVYTELPRKQGKTTLAAGIGLYGLIGDKEPGAEVYPIASKREQPSSSTLVRFCVTARSCRH